MDLKELKAKRAKRWDDLYSGIIPDQVPIDFNLSTEVYIEEYGLPVGRTLWTLEGLEDAVYNMAQHIPSDMLPKDSGRLPLHSIVSGNRGVQMGSGGFMQHPEIHTMEPEEYDEFIDSPYDFLLSKSLPRLFANMTGEDPARAMAVFYMSVKSKTDTMAQYGQIYGRVAEKLGFYAIPGPMGSRSLAPLDLFSDYPRGFTGISKDLKRCPDKVAVAADAVVPLLVKYAKPAVKSHLGSAWMPGHMPTFMRTREFEKYYYPSFSKLIHATAENGQAFKIFCEDNWTRYLDYLVELPPLSELQFEDGDPKLIKQKVGDTQIIQGLFPIQYLKNYSVEEACDKAKEVLDICAPGGQYVFGVDKSILRGNEIDWNKVQPFLDCVHEYGKYGSEAGKPSGHRDAQIVIPEFDDIKPFVSEYYQPLDKLMEYYDIVPEARQGVDESIGWAQDYLLNLTLTRLSN